MTTQAIHAGPGTRVIHSGERERTETAFPGKYLRVTTYRADGTPVATPVWFVAQTGRLLVETGAASGKIKRIRRNPAVTIAPCTARGKPRGPEVPAHAHILEASEVPRLRPAFARKYRVDLLFVKPIRALGSLLARGQAEETVVLEIIPD